MDEKNIEDIQEIFKANGINCNITGIKKQHNTITDKTSTTDLIEIREAIMDYIISDEECQKKTREIVKKQQKDKKVLTRHIATYFDIEHDMISITRKQVIIIFTKLCADDIQRISKLDYPVYVSPDYDLNDEECIKLVIQLELKRKRMTEVKVHEETLQQLNELKKILEEEYELDELSFNDVISYMLHRLMYREIQVNFDLEKEEEQEVTLSNEKTNHYDKDEEENTPPKKDCLYCKGYQLIGYCRTTDNKYPYGKEVGDHCIYYTPRGEEDK